MMSKLTLLLVGLVAGWIAEQIMGRDQTLLMNLVLGIAGAFLGSFLATRVLNLHYSEGLNPATIAIAVGGAVLLLAAAEGFNRTGSF
jgi:uncharacterized membrane protein YeaQ/YmgE (transglycosylase-associated protein family)